MIQIRGGGVLDSFEVEAVLLELGFKLVELKTHALGFEHPDVLGQRLYLKDGRAKLNDPRKVVRKQPLVLHPDIATLAGFAGIDVARRRPNHDYMNGNMSLFPPKAGGSAMGVAVSIADRAALLELLGLPGGSWSKVMAATTPSKATLSEQALWFVDCFLSPENPQLGKWWPKYRATVGQLAQALDAGDADAAFSIIWLDVDNAVSNAGRGYLGLKKAGGSKELLTRLIRDAYVDGSPEQYQKTIAALEKEDKLRQWNKTPRLLAARMFAAIHPDRYHTTVDERRQRAMLTWFEENTGFKKIRGNWAEVAQALTTHLEQLDCFNGDIFLRNMFPWFVHTRLEARNDPEQAERERKSRKQRSSETYADVAAHRRKIMLRHNALSDFLADQLEQSNPGRVLVEEPAGSGGTFDVLVLSAQHRKQGGDLYEIKVANTAGSAVRQALGQLLEYAHREPGLQPAGLYVAAEPALDAVTQAYLEQLRAQYGLPIHYHRIEMPGPLFVAPQEVMPRLPEEHAGATAVSVDEQLPMAAHGMEW